MTDTVTVRFLHPVTEDVLTLTLPRDTEFGALTKRLYAEGFIQPQKPGYRYLVADHLCGRRHLLGDYLPETSDTLEVKIFHVPQIMV